MAQHPHTDTTPAHRHITPGHDTITLAHGPTAPGSWAWDVEDGDGILLIGDHIPHNQIGAIVQAALDDPRTGRQP